MNAIQATLTVIEHEGSKWLCLPGGVLVSLPDTAVVAEVDSEEAKGAVHAELDQQAERRERVARLRDEEILRNRWEGMILRETWKLRGGHNRQKENPWDPRLDTSTRAILLMIKRGSNLRCRSNRKKRSGTWEACIAGAFRRSIQWSSGDQWDIYANNTASNLRKRFRWASLRKRVRNTYPKETSTQPEWGHAKEEGCPRDIGGSGVQVLFDWA